MATLNVVETTISPGAIIHFTGSGFTGLSSITVNVDFSSSMETVVGASVFGDIDGTITIPSNISAGTHTVRAFQGGSGVAQDTFNVTSAGAFLDVVGTGTGNSTVVQGNTITCTLSGYNGTFIPFLANGLLLDTVSRSEDGIPRTTTIWVWRIALNATPGTYTMIASDIDGNTIAQDTFTIIAQAPPSPTPTPSPAPTPVPTNTASITINPTSGAPGSTVSVTGTGYRSGSSVNLLFNGTFITIALVTTAGTFSDSMRIPSTALVGQATIRATDQSIGTITAAKTFTVTSSSPSPTPVPSPAPTPTPSPIDTTAPDTSIVSVIDDAGTHLTSGSTTNRPNLVISFVGTDNVQVAFFEYQVDTSAWVQTTSPLSLSNLSNGNHAIRIRSVDTAGLMDATPAIFNVTINTGAPSPTPNPIPTPAVDPLMIALGLGVAGLAAFAFMNRKKLLK